MRVACVDMDECRCACVSPLYLFSKTNKHSIKLFEDPWETKSFEIPRRCRRFFPLFRLYPVLFLLGTIKMADSVSPELIRGLI